MSRIYLHDELESILGQNQNRWMTYDELAAVVNLRGNYHRRDGEPLEGFQVRLRTLVSKSHAHKFEVIDEEEKVRLHIPDGESV